MMSRTRVHWIVGDGLPEHAAVLEAVPGVGNVGKILVTHWYRSTHQELLVGF